MAITFEALGRQHDRSLFSSGQRELDDWFRLRASQDEKRNVARVFVALEEQVKGEARVIGFYSLSSFTLSIPDLPEEVARKLPRYDAIPAALIGRLARHNSVRGRGIGGLLLADAIRRVLVVGRSLAIFAIVVDAKDEAAAAFYRDFAFQHFPLRPTRLFLPIATAIEALQQSELED